MGDDVVGILKTLIVGDIKAFGLMANNFNLMAEQATLLSLGRVGLHDHPASRCDRALHHGPQPRALREARAHGGWRAEAARGRGGASRRFGARDGQARRRPRPVDLRRGARRAEALRRPGVVRARGRRVRYARDASRRHARARVAAHHAQPGHVERARSRRAIAHRSPRAQGLFSSARRLRRASRLRDGVTYSDRGVQGVVVKAQTRDQGAPLSVPRSSTVYWVFEARRESP